MYSQAVDKANPKGKTRFFESYKDPLTKETKTVSVTLDRNTTQSRKTAQNILSAKIKSILAEKLPTSGENLTLLEIVNRYNDDQERDNSIRESTWRRNHRQMKACLKILGEDVLAESLTAAYVNDCFRKSGETNGRINERLTRFKAMIRWANQNGYIRDISWLSGIKSYKNTESKEKLKEKFMDAEELKKVVDAMTLEHWKLTTLFLALSGLRIGEFIALEVSDIGYDPKTSLRGNMSVTKTFYVERGIVVNNTKTDNSTRNVYIQPELAEVIDRIFDYRKSLEIDTNIFFPSKDGGYMRYNSFLQYFGDVTQRTIARRLTPHALRHTHTSLLAEKGVPLETISRRLGHGDSEITKQVYLHVTKNMEEADRKLLESITLLS